MARHSARGNVVGARRCRRMIAAEEQERDMLEYLIAGLHRRFSGPRPTTPLRPTATPTARTGTAPMVGHQYRGLRQPNQAT
jgi:hypothetical protein